MPEMEKNGNGNGDGWIIPEDSRKYLEKLFQGLKNPVTMEVYTKKGQNDTYNDYLVKFVNDIVKLSDKITAEFYTLGEARAEEKGITTSPVLLLAPEQYDIRFQGAPLGEEGRAFVEAVMAVSGGESGLGDMSKGVMKELREERHVRVFVSPTCPYCPGQAIHAIRCAVERPDLVRADLVETGENRELATKYNVGGVPHTVINEDFTYAGLVQEERFVVELVTLEDASAMVVDEHGHEHGHAHEATEVDLVIVGAGPAGLTAGIYAERSGLKTVVLEKSVIGGQVTVTPVVENYPGFANVPGKKLMDIMSAHAREYVDIHEGESVQEIKVGKLIEVITNRQAYKAGALLLCTGATWKKLGAPGEDAFFGFGVSYCASCDGYVYKDKKVAVVGGGNTALTDALHLRNLGVDVTLVHRRDEFRAEKHLQESVERENIPVLWNTEIKEIKGKDGKLTGATLFNNKDEQETELEVDGIFVAIGHRANNELAKQLGLTLDQGGFVKVDHSMRTNIPRIFAAGDVTGGVQQIVTAVGEGSTAALSAFEDISHPYWK